MEEKKLTPRERDFCRSYVSLGDASEAAAFAGFEGDTRKKGEELLSKDSVAKEINRLCEARRQMISDLATVGYQRLAFGSIADAVSLLYMENPSSEELRKMDLYSISEIKRPKDGSMEIKFFDRLKALEKLCDGTKEEHGAVPIYEAIVKGARALSETEEAEDDEA